MGQEKENHIEDKEEKWESSRKMKRGYRRYLPLFLALCLCLTVPVQGAASQRKPKKAYTGWKTRKGKTYYLRKGKPVKGLRKIGKWYHYFDGDGRMVTGWARVKNEYRYFGSRTGRMRTAATIKGRRINRKGVWKPRIVLDPGHSGVVSGGVEPNGPGSLVMKAKDTYGTQGVATGVPEYQLNLDIAMKVREALEKRGCQVIMVRTDHKKSYSCIQRASVANKAKADLFLRIHANGGSSPHQSGAMTICTTRSNPYAAALYQKSKALSQAVLDAYVKETGCRREYVWETDTMTGNNWSKVPVTILEMGYMSNPGEDVRMQSPAYQKKMVRGIVNGIEDYLLGK
ncbi:MAG: N-acetylmuramoyl-L-alanine amidase [Eubacteriales bacterium]|nr:N-acetylmuramoyl-L-alanine amidase [Eubacteriales bacterium]